MLKISNIKISVREKITDELIINKVKRILRCQNIKSVKIVKKSVDARDKSDVFYNLAVEASVDNEDRY